MHHVDRFVRRSPALAGLLTVRSSSAANCCANRDGLHPGFRLGASLEGHRADLHHGGRRRFFSTTVHLFVAVSGTT
jgi:hypothetical protein